MTNMSLVQNRMPVQEPENRVKNFDEASLGYTREQAVDEARRCLSCRYPLCQNKCPLNVDIPGFITLIAGGRFEDAYTVITKTSLMPGICGRVCHPDTMCESACPRGQKGESVAIGALERFAADAHAQKLIEEGLPKRPRKTDIKVFPPPEYHPAGRVAVIGSGPASLAFAAELAGSGCLVTVLEARREYGGVLAYGIPCFRLPKAVVKRELGRLSGLSIIFRPNVAVGETTDIETLMGECGFDAVFIGSGAGRPKSLAIPGADFKGVSLAAEFLESCESCRRGGHTVVIGGGGTAIDAARCAVRLGSTVTIVYRRGEKDMPARPAETAFAREEGIGFRFNAVPVEIVDNGSGKAAALRCLETKEGAPDASGRPEPVPVSGSEFELPADRVIIATGSSPATLPEFGVKGLETDKHGCIIVDERTGATSLAGVYSGGGAAGCAGIVQAMGDGQRAADAIRKMLLDTKAGAYSSRCTSSRAERFSPSRSSA